MVDDIIELDMHMFRNKYWRELLLFDNDHYGFYHWIFLLHSGTWQECSILTNLSRWHFIFTKPFLFHLVFRLYWILSLSLWISKTNLARFLTQWFCPSFLYYFLDPFKRIYACRIFFTFFCTFHLVFSNC